MTVDPHPPTQALARLTLDAVTDQLVRGETTSLELASAALARIAALDARDCPTALGAVLRVADDALEVAAERDAESAAGGPRGRLQGVTVLVKDNIEAAGLPGTAGSLALADRPVTADAPLVSRLRAAGAVIVGATNLSEWANFRSPRSTSGWSAAGGLTGNPWALDRSAGGSSSGSGAAVAAGLSVVAIGTETNGSITCPAALNGVVGLKPTVGSVPMAGVVPISASQDVAGPLARSVRDAAAVYEVISGRDDCLSACRPEVAAGLRVGVVEAWLSGDARTDALFAAAVDRVAPLVSQVRSASVPFTASQVYADQVDVLLGELRDDLDAYLAQRTGGGVRSVADVVAFNRDHADSELAHFGQEFLELAADRDGRRSEEYRQARRRNVEFARDACLAPAIASGLDVLVAPAYRPAWKSDLTHGDQLAGGGAICTPAAILGWPLLTVPMGLVDGLPVGFSITGPPRSEPALLALGHALEAALGLLAAGALVPKWRPSMRG